jgi:hypothetical protein
MNSTNWQVSEEMVGRMAVFMGSLGVQQLPTDTEFSKCVLESVEVQFCLSSDGASECSDLPEVDSSSEESVPDAANPSPLSHFLLLAIQACAPTPQMDSRSFLTSLNSTLRQRAGELDELMEYEEHTSELPSLVREFLDSLDAGIPATADAAGCVVDFVQAKACMRASDNPNTECPGLPEGNGAPDEDPKIILRVASEAIIFCVTGTEYDESFIRQLNTTLEGELADLDPLFRSDTADGKQLTNMVDFLSGIPVLDDLAGDEAFAQCVVQAGSHFICHAFPAPGGVECPPLPARQGGSEGSPDQADIIEVVLDVLTDCYKGEMQHEEETRNALEGVRSEIQAALSHEDDLEARQRFQVSKALLISLERRFTLATTSLLCALSLEPKAPHVLSTSVALALKYYFQYRLFSQCLSRPPPPLFHRCYETRRDDHLSFFSFVSSRNN